MFIYLIIVAGVLPFTVFALFDWRQVSPRELLPETNGVHSHRRVSFRSTHGDYNLNVTISAVLFEVQKPQGCKPAYLQFRSQSNSNITVVAVHG